jgi:hypothetical protein
MNILDKLLSKRGIKSPDELSPEERVDFDNWRKILSKEILTIEDIKSFCQSQIDVIVGKWADLNLDTDKKAQLIPYFTVYTIIKQVTDSPKVARENLENQLNQLLK